MDAKQLVSDGLQLVTLPDVYLRVKAVLEDPRSSAADMASAIETDPAVTARLLRMANSSFFGFAATISSVSRAVSMLGTVQVHDMVLATSLAQTFAGVESEALNVARFWRNSVRRAVGAKVLAGACNVLDGERVFLAGLLSQIGEMVLALRAPDELQQSYLAAAAEQLPLAQVQRRQFGCDYAEVGAELLAAWQLPASLEQTVRFHTEPRRAVDFPLETAIVHFAAVLVGADAERLDEAAVALTGLVAAELEEIPAQIERDAIEVFALLHGPAGKDAQRKSA